MQTKYLKFKFFFDQGRYRTLTLLFALATLWLFGSVPAVKAQNEIDTGTALTLQDSQDQYKLGPYIYMTRDPGKLLNFTNYEKFVRRHLAGDMGTPMKGDILNLGIGATPYWLIFGINNQSWNENWVLSLGQHLDGRVGLIDEIFVYDHVAQKTYINTLTAAKNPYIKAARLNGTSLSLPVPNGQKTLIFLYVVPKPGMPTTLVPELMTEEVFLAKSQGVMNPNQILNFFLIAMLGFTLATVFVKKMWSAATYFLYYLVILFLFNHQNNYLQTDLPLASHLPGLLFSASALCGLLANKFFLGISKLQRMQNLILMTFFLIVLCMAGTAAFFMPDHSEMQILTMYWPPLVTFLFLFMLSLAQGYTGRQESYMIALGWLAVFLGGTMTAVSLVNIFPPPALLMNAYWYAIIIQGLLFIMAIIDKVGIEERFKEISFKELQQEQESISNILAAKESSENARLLRMIDHERDVMNELREREAQQNTELRKAKDVADQANNAKSAFLAVISHEIRTPMTGVMGMVRLLLDTPLNAKQKEYAKTIQDSGDAMIALLNDILDFEKIESGKMDLEHIDFDLHRLINGVKTLMSGHAEAKNIYLKINMASDIPRYVIGDPVRLRQVILNLAGNSIKFTNEGGVTIHVKSEQPQGGKNHRINRIRFAVEDTGVGISKEAQKNLFNPFSQADSSVSRKFGGSGLGLAISQKLIEAMGGRIQIDSTEGHGSTFFFTVNMEKGSAEAVQKVEGGYARTLKPDKVLKILIVEDNEVNQKLMKELVDRMGHITTLAGSGEDALKIFEDDQFDLVLMDLQLPGMSGMGTTKAIRSLDKPEKSATPVIAMTGNVRDEDIRQCFAANMNGHLAKPIDPKRLKEQIEKVMTGNLDNPVEIQEDRKDTYMPMTRLNIGTDKFGEEDSSATILGIEDKDLENGEEETELQFTENEESPLPPPAEDIAPITALAMESSENPVSMDVAEEELEIDSFEEAMQYDAKENSAPTFNGALKEGDVFNRILLEGLRSSVGDEKFISLMEDMLEKTDEILHAIDQASNANNWEALASHAHELKGMTGNFGLIEISRIAARMEAIAKDKKESGLQPVLSALPPARERVDHALQDWLSETTS